MKSVIITLGLLVYCMFCTLGCNKEDTSIHSHQTFQDSYFYGITLDSIENIDMSVDAIKSLSKRVVTRVVFDEVPATAYITALEKLSPHTDIMGELFDSEYIQHYSMNAYRARVDNYLAVLANSVSIWEIGNEVNGEWTGDPKEVAEKTRYAYRAAKQKKYLTALTLYYNDYLENDGCWNKPEEKMREWVKRYLSDEIKMGVDYVFVSYYEEDCDNHQPTRDEWESVFADLGVLFPNSKLGFGEVGMRKQLKKESYLQRYYSLDLQHPRYIGGYFWWYFKQDMVPKSKAMWSIFNTILQNK